MEAPTTKSKSTMPVEPKAVDLLMAEICTALDRCRIPELLWIS